MSQQTSRTPGAVLVPRRRRPRMVRFLLTGGVIGVLLGLFLSVIGPPVPNTSPTQELIVMAFTIGALGTLLAAIAYLVAERISSR